MVESNILESANMFFLSKETNEKERSKKSQLMVFTTLKKSDDAIRGALVWSEDRFFEDLKVLLFIKRL